MTFPAYLETHGRRLIENGFEILPILPGAKRPDAGLGWQKIAADTVQLEAWIREGKGAHGVGVLGARSPGVDLDITDGAVLQKVLLWCDENIGTAPRRIGRPPRVLLACRTDVPFRSQKSAKFRSPDGAEHQIEIIAQGGQYVAYHVHPDTGLPYSWPDWELTDVSIDVLPTLDEDGARKLIAYFHSIVPLDWTRLQRANGGDGEHQSNPQQSADWPLVQDALNNIPNNDLDYQDWIRIGYALKGAAGEREEAACDAFHEWSSQSQKYDPEITQKAWDAVKAERIGAGTVFMLAEANGWSRPRVSASDEFGPVEVECGDTERRRATAVQRGFYTVSISDALELALAQNSRPLVDGVLDQGTLADMYGKPNCGKSFVALDLGLSVASGRPWAGRETQQGLVVYLAAEGGGGIHRRLRAAVLQKGIQHDVPFAVAPCSVDLFAGDADLKSIVAHVRSLATMHDAPPRLIVVDTLARVLGAGDENSGKDMGQLIRNLDRIKEQTGATVLVVHHSGKDASKGSRGHSSLLGAVDTEIEIADRKIRTTKQRDHEPLKPEIRFDLRGVNVGVDAAGRDITSCFVQYLTGAEFEPIPLAPAAEKMKSSLSAACATSADGEVSWVDWQKAHFRVIEPEWRDGAERPRGCSDQNLRRLRNDVVESGHASQSGPDRYTLAA